MLTFLEEHTRECHGQRADRALKARDVLEWVGPGIREHGALQSLRSDYGPEFIRLVLETETRRLSENAIWASRRSFASPP